MSVRLWRCVECGRWSHAERRPSSHQRKLRCTHEFGFDEPPPGAVVVEELGGIEHDTGAWSLWGWMLKCGPFEEWRAERVA